MVAGLLMVKSKISQKRLRQIVNTLMLEGLSIPLARMRLSHCASLSCRLHCTWKRWTGNKSDVLPWPRAVKNALIRLGPAFVKIGQILSVRSDLIPPKLAQELHSLQSSVPPVPTEELFSNLTTELGHDPDTMFSKIFFTPLAAGSIAQVHRACYADGREVVLKIKRPQIDKMVKEDLDILIWMAHFLEKHVPESRAYHPVASALELQNYTLRELDFRQEARVARQVRHMFSDWQDVLIPEVYYASENLIVMEYIHGTPLDNLEQLKSWELNHHDLILYGMKVILAQIFDFGLFHADPHPGNLHVTPKGKLLLLDFGIFGRLNPEMQKKSILLMSALMNGDLELASLFLINLASLSEKSDVPAFRQSIETRYQEWRGSSVKEYGFARLVYEEFTLGSQYGVLFPANLILLSKAMLTIEGVVLSVEPDLDISQAAAPVFNELKQKYFSGTQLKHSILRSLPLWWSLLDSLPLNLALTLHNKIQHPQNQIPEPSKANRPLQANHLFLTLMLTFGVLTTWQSQNNRVLTGLALILITLALLGEVYLEKNKNN